MKNLILGLCALFCFASCGSDDMEMEQEMMNECDGNLSYEINGQSASLDGPIQAVLFYSEQLQEHELIAAWVANGLTISFQLVLDLDGLDCVPSQRYNLTSLPPEVSIFNIQYASLQEQVSVSNVFSEPSDTGFIEVTACDGSSEMVDVTFGFSGQTTQGESITLTNAVAGNICFSRTK